MREAAPRRRMSGRGWTIVILCVILGIGVLVGAGYFVNKALFSEKSGEGSSFSLEASPVYNEALYDINQYYFKPFSEAKITDAAEKAVKDAQKKGETSPDKLLDVGLTALGKALDDEHSGYMNASQNKRLTEDLSGSFYGVGFTLKVDKDKEGKGTDRPKVVSVIKDSPSDKAGVKKDDLIMSVDGKDTKGVPLDTVILWIRGKNGTKVNIKAKRGDESLDFNMVREKITIPDLETEIVDGKYGVLRLFEFNSGVGQKVRDAVRDMQSKGVQGFILDLRNDPGGLLDEAVKVSSVFINDGVIVSYQTKGSPKVDEKARGGAETALPLVVLTNGGSASSSEIVAGAIKDHKRGTLVGTKTYGKGSVQKVYELDNDGAMKLTISLYYLPNGESIDGTGIEPDVMVEAKDDPNEDQIQLDRAKQVLQNLIDGKPPTGVLLQLAA
ncbi:MAG: S41 family peptidase [Actinobacteria bacterium]|nr:S41 family peptidase [Actinomycetota bacterium]